MTVAVRGNKEPAWMWAAAWGAVHAFRLANDPSRQSKGIAVVGLAAPKRCQDYERAGWIDGTAATVQQGYFVINASDKNRLDQQVVVSVVGNLMIEATALEFAA